MNPPTNTIGNRIQLIITTKPKTNTIISNTIPIIINSNLIIAPIVLEKPFDTMVSKYLAGLNPLPYPQLRPCHGATRVFNRCPIEKNSA